MKQKEKLRDDIIQRRDDDDDDDDVNMWLLSIFHSVRCVWIKNSVFTKFIE